MLGATGKLRLSAIVPKAAMRLERRFCDQGGLPRPLAMRDTDTRASVRAPQMEAFMIRIRTTLFSISTAVIVSSCSGSDANLGDGQQNATGNSGGSAGSAGGDGQKAGSAGSAGSAVSTGAGGTCNSGLGIACAIDSGSGETDGMSGGVTCGAQTCQTGQSCCEVPGPNEICTPTCSNGPCPGVACKVSVDAGSTTDAGPLSWHETCGLPVCPNDPPPLGIPACTADQKAGASCSTSGTQCDAMLACGAKLECADHNLTQMCPRSIRGAKQDIRYVTKEDLQHLADEVAKIRLTTYTYKDPSLGNDEHLGFIIDDNPASTAVYPNHQRVDLYGYTSMAVATLQVQQQQLKSQQQQMEELQREIVSLRAELGASTSACSSRK